jgi:hypothetical protein
MIFKRFVLFFITTAVLSACFEIVEDVSFKKNGSGSIKIIFNLSQSKNELNSLMKLDSSSGYEIPNKKKINDYLDQSFKLLQSTEGLSDVQIKRDFDNWIFEIKANFNNTEHLELGLKNIYANFSGGKPFTFRNKLVFDGKNLKREVQNLDENTRLALNKPTEKKIFANAKYTTIYRFESPIKKSTNTKAKISPSKKAIMLKANILNIINGKETIQNNIQLNEP